MQFFFQFSGPQQHHLHNGNIHLAPYAHMGVPFPVSGVSYPVPITIIPNMFHRGDGSGVFLPPPDGPINTWSNLNTVLQTASSSVMQMSEQPYKLDLENTGQVRALELYSVKAENKDLAVPKIDCGSERDKCFTNEKNLARYHEENIVKTENEPGKQTGQVNGGSVINTRNLLSADNHELPLSYVTKSEIPMKAEIVEVDYMDKVENKVPVTYHYQEESVGEKHLAVKCVENHLHANIA